MQLWQAVRRKKFIVVSALAIIVAGSVIYFWRDVTGTFEAVKEKFKDSDRVVTERSTLNPPNSSGINLFLNRSTVRSVVVYNGKRYASTSGGLAVITDEGLLDKVYTVMDGLPENDLGAMAVYQNRLYIATPDQGLIGFDGSNFTRYRFKQPEATNVTVLLPTETELLVGTFDGGLFEFDGQTFTRRYHKSKGADFKSITALADKDSRLYVGTQDRGLYIWREGHFDHVTHLEGMPSDHVTSIVRYGGQILVATDFGVVQIAETGQAQPYNMTPNITSLVEYNGKLYAGLFTGGVAEIRRDQKAAMFGKWIRTAGSTFSPASLSTEELPKEIRLQADSSVLWAATQSGLYKLDDTLFNSVALSRSASDLRHSHVSSLALDWAGRLWVGYFDGGVDVVLPDNKERFTQFEDINLREVNFLRLDADRSRMLVATSAGMFIFDTRLLSQRFSERDGLISDSVNHISLASDIGFGGAVQSNEPAVVLSTGRGLTMVQGAVPRSLSAFNGLANNHVYTSLPMNGRLYLGTLGGLSELEHMRVSRTFTTSNSKIAANWVTALANVDGTLFVGTNGGGVQALTPAGDWLDFKDEIGRFDVNVNAMFYDGAKLFVGTLNRGVFVYDTRKRTWSNFTNGLGSLNVTAIVADADHIYFGTFNGITSVERRLFN